MASCSPSADERRNSANSLQNEPIKNLTLWLWVPNLLASHEIGGSWQHAHPQPVPWKNEIRHLALQAASPRAKSQAIIDETSPKSLAPILRTKASKGLRRPGNSLINGRNYLLMSATCELLNINESMRYIWKRKIKKLPSFILV